LAISLIVGVIAEGTNAAAKSVRASLRAECVRLAAAQNFGRRHIQRRNFIQDCVIDRDFNSPDLL
jgi:hypothetical protein